MSRAKERALDVTDGNEVTQRYWRLLLYQGMHLNGAMAYAGEADRRVSLEGDL